MNCLRMGLLSDLVEMYRSRTSFFGFVLDLLRILFVLAALVITSPAADAVSPSPMDLPGPILRATATDVTLAIGGREVLLPQTSLTWPQRFAIGIWREHRGELRPFEHNALLFQANLYVSVTRLLSSGAITESEAARILNPMSARDSDSYFRGSQSTAPKYERAALALLTAAEAEQKRLQRQQAQANMTPAERAMESAQQQATRARGRIADMELAAAMAEQRAEQQERDAQAREDDLRRKVEAAESRAYDVESRMRSSNYMRH